MDRADCAGRHAAGGARQVACFCRSRRQSARNCWGASRREGVDAVGGTPEAFVAQIKREIPQWRDVAASSNIKIEQELSCAKSPIRRTRIQKLKLALPPGACDCHIHLFGAKEKFPFAADAQPTSRSWRCPRLQHRAARSGWLESRRCCQRRRLWSELCRAGRCTGAVSGSLSRRCSDARNGNQRRIRES